MADTLYQRALKIAKEAHGTQVDNEGTDYVQHLISTANLLTSEVEQATGLLHETIAHSSMTLSDLREQDIPNEVVLAVNVLTKKRDVDYFTYIAKIKSNEIARQVKMASLTNKVTVLRKNKNKKQNIERIDKYEKAIEYLK